MRTNRLKEFIDSEAASALPLVVAALLALVLANSPLAGNVESLLDTRLGLSMAWLVGEHTYQSKTERRCDRRNSGHGRNSFDQHSPG